MLVKEAIRVGFRRSQATTLRHGLAGIFAGAAGPGVTDAGSALVGGGGAVPLSWSSVSVPAAIDAAVSVPSGAKQ
jgi:hypothetical protein